MMNCGPSDKRALEAQRPVWTRLASKREGASSALGAERGAPQKQLSAQKTGSLR